MKFLDVTKKYFSISPAAFGLDISDTSVKFIQLIRQGEYFDLLARGERDVPRGVIEKGVIKKPSELSKILKNALVLKRPKNLSQYVIFSLPDEETFLKQIQLPQMTMEEMESAVYVEAERNIPIDVKEAYLDFDLLDLHEKTRDHRDILIAAARRSTVDTYTDVLRDAGLTPVALEPEVIAISRSAVAGGASKKPVLVVEIGANRTRLVAFVKNTIAFTGAANFSADALNNALASGLNMEKTDLLRLSNKSKKFEDEKFAVTFDAVLKKELSPLAEAIKDYGSYLATQTENKDLSPRSFETIVLSGGGSRVPRVEKQLSLILKIRVRQVNPWVNVLPHEIKETPELSLRESVRFTTAMGLALRGAGINLNDIKEMQ